MGFTATKWTDGDFIPKSGLLAWHAADTATDGQTVEDASGNNRTLDSGFGSTPPDLVPDVINGLPAIVFDGSTHDPLQYTGSVTPKHCFVVAAHEDPAFPAGALGNGGILTGLASTAILIGNAESTRFFDLNLDSVGAFKYRRRDAEFAEGNMQAAFDGNISIFEVENPAGYPLTGLQIGRDRDFATRLWKGPWCEHLIYSRVLEDIERAMVMEYLAMKYHLWRQTTAGKNVWPFQPDWGRPLNQDKLVLSSTTVSGTRKARSKSSSKKAFELSFTDRSPEEYDAALAFWDEHYPGTSIVYRDDAFVPGRDTEALITSPLSQSAQGYRQIGYGVQLVEV